MKPDRLPPVEALALLLVVMSLCLLLGPPLEAMGLAGVAASQWLLIAAPTLLWAHGRGGVRPLLGLAWPRRRDLGGAALAGASIWYVLSWAVLPLQERIAPAPPELRRALEELAYAPTSPALVLFAVAVTPAVCEELLCRGALARGLRGALGLFGATVASALLFGALHLSIYRFVPTFALGLVLGWATLTAGSVVPAMVIHLLNNMAVIAIRPGSAVAVWLNAHAAAAGVTALCALALGLYLIGSRK